MALIMDELRQTVVRIDENVKLLREDVQPLINKVQEHAEELAVLKNDKKWAHGIFTTLIGLAGVVLGALAEYFRK